MNPIRVKNGRHKSIYYFGYFYVKNVLSPLFKTVKQIFLLLCILLLCMIRNVLGHPHLQPLCTQSRKSWRKSTSQLKTSRGGSKNWKFSNPIHPQRRQMLLWRFQLNKSSLAVRNNSQNVRLLYQDAFIFLFPIYKKIFLA